MAETMEQYMSKTRADYGSGVARPKIEDKDSFELKGQFLKELRDNTFSGSDHEDANEHIEKVLEIVDLFHIPNITIDQVMLRAFPMSLTGAASHWLRNKPSGSITTWEDLKTKFLSKYCPPARTAKKMEEINNFQQEPDENLYQAWERFKELLMKCPQHYLTKMQEVVLFYNGLDVPTRQILDSRGVIPLKTTADAKQYKHKLNNLGREIKKVNEKVYVAQVGCKQCKGPHYTKDCPLKEEGTTLDEAYYTQFASTDAAIRNQGSSIKTLEIQIGQMSKVLQEKGFGSLPSSTKTNLIDHVKSISTIVDADTRSIRRIGSHQYAVSTKQNSALMYETKQMTIPFLSRLNDCYYENKKGSYEQQFSEAYSYGASHIDKSIPGKEKDPGSFTLLCYINNVCLNKALADLEANVSVMPLSTYLNLDFIILDMPEDIKMPLIFGRPFLSTAHAKIDVFKRKITLRVREEKIIFKSVKRASSLIKRVYMLNLRERMELDLETRLMGDTLVLHRSLDPFFEDYTELNDLNVPLELRREQVDDLMLTIKEGEVIEEFRARNDARLVSKNFGYPSNCDHDKEIGIDYAHNLKFSCMIDFAILEDMDAYRGERMGNVIFGEPFLREVRINAKRFEGMITIHNGNEEVTYQMVPSHSRFKYHTNE
ncbi:mitochondrial proton/calcium exchanger protein-like protein isoform X1 [Tanacetum coccineum]